MVYGIIFMSVKYIECADWCLFLCWICREFLDKVQSEIDCKPDPDRISAGNSILPSVDVGDDVIKQLFQGKLISEVPSHRLLI